MKRILSVRDAKEYLAGRIVAQADRDVVALSDIERKMLYFSETGWTLPDMMAVSREFDETYDQDEYEAKIGGIVRGIRDERDDSRDDEEWDWAVDRLAWEDHYLLVLIAAADSAPAKKARWGIGRLILAGVVGAAVWTPFLFFVLSHVHQRAVAEPLLLGSLMGLAVLVTWVASRGKVRSN